MFCALRLAAVFAAFAGVTIAHGQGAGPAASGLSLSGEPARVTLTSSGAEPRRAVRLAIAPNYRSGMRMDVTRRLTVRVADQFVGARFGSVQTPVTPGKTGPLDAAGTSVPFSDVLTMRTNADVAVTSVTPEGDVAYKISFSDIHVSRSAAGVTPWTDNAAIEFQASQLRTDLKTITATATITNRGIMQRAKVEPPTGTGPIAGAAMAVVADSVNSMSLPLPEEAVGVGATWDVRRITLLGEANRYQILHCELIKLDDRAATVKVTIGQESSSALVTSAGKGRMVVALNGLVPTNEFDSHGSTLPYVSLSGEIQAPPTDSTITTKISPVK